MTEYNLSKIQLEIAGQAIEPFSDDGGVEMSKEFVLDVPDDFDSKLIDSGTHRGHAYGVFWSEEETAYISRAKALALRVVCHTTPADAKTYIIALIDHLLDCQ